MGNLDTFRIARRLAFAAMLWLAAGCSSPEPDPDRLWVDRIRVIDESDGLFGLLDIEIHLFDHATGEHLGCSSLEPVDLADMTYELEAYFVRGKRRVTPADLSGHDVVIEVIEDDSDPCPSPPVFNPKDLAADDPVGTSAPIAGDLLGTTGPLNFGKVPLLEIGLHP